MGNGAYIYIQGGQSGPGRPGPGRSGLVHDHSIHPCTVLISTYLIRRVHRKWHSVQRLVTHNARKTLRMVRLSGGPQYPIEDRSEALAALLQRV